MDCANDAVLNVLALAVIDNAVRIFAAQAPIAGKIVSAQQANSVRNSFAHESFERLSSDVLNYTGDDVALTFDGANYCCFALAAADVVIALVPMPIFVFSADVGLVYFNNAAKLFNILDQRRSDFVTSLPVPFAAGEIVDRRIAAARAPNARRPATSHQIGSTSIFVREHPLKLSGGKLVNGFGSLSHDTPPTMEGYCHA